MAMVRRRSPHVFGGVLGLVLLLWGIGFANFNINNASISEATAPASGHHGIVVPTGGNDRLQWGMNALTQGRGERLLISGVNEVASPEDLRGLVDDPDELFGCCVDLDYTARNTIANAEETAAWASEHEFEGLWVVTSYYHMPRTLAELHYRAPELILYPLRVRPEDYSAGNWWRPGTFRILAWEYTKYELALMRIRFAVLFGD